MNCSECPMGCFNLLLEGNNKAGRAKQYNATAMAKFARRGTAAGSDWYLIFRKLHIWFGISYWYELYIYMNIEWIVPFSHQIIELYYIRMKSGKMRWKLWTQLPTRYMDSEIIFLLGRVLTKINATKGGGVKIFCLRGEGRYMFFWNKP